MYNKFIIYLIFPLNLSLFSSHDFCLFVFFLCDRNYCCWFSWPPEFFQCCTTDVTCISCSVRVTHERRVQFSEPKRPRITSELGVKDVTDSMSDRWSSAAGELGAKHCSVQ